MSDNQGNIHNLFSKADEPKLGAIDTSSVIRRSKARRLPMQLATGGALALAVGGLAFGGAQLISTERPVAGSAAAESDETGSGTESGTDSADGDLAAGGESIKRAPAEKVNFCTGTLAEVGPAPSGLVFSVDFPDASAGSVLVIGTVTLTNNGSAPVTGTTYSVPAITVSSDGIVKWHSNGAIEESAVVVDLAPGESLEYAASFKPVECGVEDDSAESFRDDLPALPAGEYEVSALIDFSSDGPVELVSGPADTITLG